MCKCPSLCCRAATPTALKTFLCSIYEVLYSFDTESVKVSHRNPLLLQQALLTQLLLSLVQIPIALFGLVFFDASWSFQNVGSVLVGLAAGVIFVRAKQLDAA